MTTLFKHFGIGPEHRLGGGGEADVYALGAERVVRVMKAPADIASEDRRRALLERLSKPAEALSFAIPQVLDFGIVGAKIFTVERRIDGIAMDLALGHDMPHRAELVTNYMQAALDLGRIHGAGFFGELGGADPLTAADQTSALASIAARSLASAGLTFDPTPCAAALPQPTRPGLAHIDYFPGNVMCDGATITGVLDFGYSTIAADARLTAIIAGACLHSRLAANANDGDRKVADGWLAERGLAQYLAPTNVWLAAFWAFAYPDDPALEVWGKKQLGL